MSAKSFPYVLTFVMLLSSCGDGDSNGDEKNPGGLKGTTWRLVKIDAIDGGSIVLDQIDTIVLSFDDERRISGKSPGMCGNTYFGLYTITEENTFRTDSLLSTQAYCPASQYHYFYDQLRKAEKYRRTGARLELLCDNQSQRLVFRSYR